MPTDEQPGAASSNANGGNNEIVTYQVEFC